MDQSHEPEPEGQPWARLREWFGVPRMINKEWTALSYFFAFVAGALLVAALIAFVVLMVREIAYHL